MKRSQGKAKSSALPGAAFGGFSAFGGPSGGSSLSYLAEPPAFSAVSDPNAVVCFKSVLKKDSTTKAKALDELIAYVQDHPYEKDGGVEEAVLDVWVQLYPRISIDNARRVRELSHTLQFELMKSARKRMERYVPTIVGAWLAGIYDRDRAVARAANSGLSSFLTTPEKVVAFWRKCHIQILEYALSAIQETQDTLSDDRSTTKEDAEAKYFRVVTASLSLALGLLQKVDANEFEKHVDRYDDYFSQDSVWKSITFEDALARKTACHLLFVCLERNLPYATTTKAKQAFITGGLRTNQAGSALEYVRAVTKLTQSSPDIWTYSNEKKSPLTRLGAFVAKGSQGSPPKFWEHLNDLLSLLPTELLSIENASTLLTSLKSGVTNREEPRTNTSPAWKCYIDTAERLLKSLPPEHQLTFGRDHLFPLFEQFLFSVSGNTRSVPVGPNAMSVLVEAYVALAGAEPPLVSAFAEEWDKLAGVLRANISASLPEVSQEFRASQEKIAEEGRRWFGLVGHLHGKLQSLEKPVTDHTSTPSAGLVSHSISLLATRNLKPFGAASLLEYALSTSPHLFGNEKWQEVFDFLYTTAQKDANKAIESPSSKYIFSCIRLLGSFNRDDEYTKLWNSWLGAVLALGPGAARDDAIASLISHQKGGELSRRSGKLQETIASQILATASSTEPSWDLLEAVITYGILSEDAIVSIAKALSSFVSKHHSNPENVLKALELLVKGFPDLFKHNIDLHAALIAQLLSLTEIQDQSVSSQAAKIRALLDGQSDGQVPVVGVIHANLDRANPNSLEIDTLVQQVKDSSNVSQEELYPSANVWMTELQPFLSSAIDPALSITSIVEGAISLVDSPTSSIGQVQRDRKGRSVPVRMCQYLNRLLADDTSFPSLPEQFQVELLYLQAITSQIVSDQITAVREDGPWKSLQQTDAVFEAEELVSAARNVVNAQVQAANSRDIQEAPVLYQLFQLLVKQASALTPLGLYSSRSLGELVQVLVETNGLTTSLETELLKAEFLKVAPETVLVAAAVLAGLGEAARSSKVVNTFCNRLVSEVAGAKPQAEKTHMTLVLLTLSGRIYDSGELPVANNRVVFAVRQITSWLEEPDELRPELRVEIFRSLTQLLPCMKEVYGTYWEKAIEFCISSWTNARDYSVNEYLPIIHSSLRLIKTLESLPEPNDDLVDVLKDFAESKSKSLIELLKLDRDATSQPLEIVDGMICREVEKIPTRHISDLSDIFPLVASESRDIQTAAFNLLHRAIPPRQEQQAVDALLDKTDARLQDELLSLLLDAPTLEQYTEDALAAFPSPVRCYLLAWKLVFDTFSSSPFKLRTDYTENLKADGCVAPLLDFMFDVLGHSAAHPLRLDKVRLGVEQIKDYDVKLADSENEEKSMQWLLVHLFYLALKFVPGLFRAWYIDCRSKQTRIAVESWTTKYFAPLIVDDALDEVQAWAEAQEPPPADEQELVVKVSKPAREVTAGYEVDESQASIAIKVPQSYPIENVTVVGLNRVAVTERKWQSWIMTTQGVITFSNGNIIDGLQVFKRNIVGALKGQGECAICYSIISTDKRMPDKRCTTCKNLFHRTCLYKWFQSSNQNTCPLCRNPIDYLGADTAKRRAN